MSVRAPTGVGEGYRHVAKHVTPAPAVALGDAVLKWYDVAPADAPVPSELQDAARDALQAAAASSALGLSGDLGFVILHRCGEAFYFLLVSTWRNDNELWETVWARDGAGQRDFAPWPVEGAHRPTFCVWELGAVCHERLVWSRYLRSPRDEAARDAYLADSYEGAV